MPEPLSGNSGVGDVIAGDDQRLGEAVKPVHRVALQRSFEFPVMRDPDRQYCAGTGDEPRIDAGQCAPDRRFQVLDRAVDALWPEVATKTVMRGVNGACSLAWRELAADRWPSGMPGGRPIGESRRMQDHR